MHWIFLPGCLGGMDTGPSETSYRRYVALHQLEDIAKPSLSYLPKICIRHRRNMCRRRSLRQQVWILPSQSSPNTCRERIKDEAANRVLSNRCKGKKYDNKRCGARKQVPKEMRVAASSKVPFNALDEKERSERLSNLKFERKFLNSTLVSVRARPRARP